MLSPAQWILRYSYDLSEILAYMHVISESSGAYQHQVSYLGDLRGLSLFNTLGFLPVIKRLIRQVDVHFPGLAGQTLLINVPCADLWPAVKAFLDPQTASKVFIEVGDARGKIDLFFGKEIVPVEWGGSNDLKIVHST